ncbi:MAG: threonine/serine dehydratase [Rhizobiaceae bacterium]|nr:threonine/serine dehydratase [Rhizobiaceae bacterium]
MTASIPSIEHLQRAYEETRRVTLVTPLLESAAIAKQAGAARVFVKPESLQWTGSFKSRGAYWRLKTLSAAEAAKGVVAYSSGNFAQGLAASGQRLGIPVTIVMPVDAPLAKREATAGYGARVILTDHGQRAREEVAMERAQAIARDEGLTLLHPFDHPEVIAGQAGVGLEALDQLRERNVTPDLVFVPTGGGGLVSGVSLAFSYHSPQTRMIVVEPERFNGMGASLEAGAAQTVPLTAPPSICDGMMARRPGVSNFAVMSSIGAQAVTVGNDEVRSAMRLAFERLKLVLEPSAASSLAALLGGSVDVSNKTVLVVATGGNIALADFLEHVRHA